VHELESPPPTSRTESSTPAGSGSSRRHDDLGGSSASAGSGRGSFATTQEYSGASRINGGSILGAQGAGASPARPLFRNPRSINMTRTARKKINDLHMPGGAKLNSIEKSYFHSSENLDDLVKRAEGKPAFFQGKSGYYERVIRVPDRTIGTLSQKLGGKKTNIYTVLTYGNGDVFDAFPGYPPPNYRPH
jgi:hypothetical protein